MARLLDGEAIWTSDKLKKVDPKYRGEYSYILPICNVHGYFPFNPELVWSRVYSYNRPDITVENVKEMLDAFVAADMISVHELYGKKYGFFVGIDKEGRLPAPSRRKGYKDSYPSAEDFAEYAISK